MRLARVPSWRSRCPPMWQPATADPYPGGARDVPAMNALSSARP